MRYRDTVAGGDDRVFSGLDSQLSDSERFRDAAPFVIRCRHCQVQVPFVPLNDADANILASSGPGCPACSKNISSTQLGVQIRDAIAKYYEGWTRCDAPTCNNRTGMMGVYGRRCLKSNCKGRVSFEYSDTQLYNQLRYFVSLFDGEKALTLAPPNRREEIAAIVLKNQMILRTLTDCVERHLNHCGRRWIDLSVIFSAMRV
ncbi:hypothetical protein CPC08DRAFT_478292 [Agrocybe pediades]|nr:hypothetical protein CPC08DRAFT_478292 [Agrocybe pediades]